MCLREIDFSFDKLHYLGTVNFKHEKQTDDEIYFYAELHDVTHVKRFK